MSALSAVSGSGEAGRITKRDVVERLAPPAAAVPAAPAATSPARAPAPSKPAVAPAAAAGRRPRAEERVRMSQAPADDRAQSRRGAAHGRDADDVQRGRHDRGHGAPRTAQAGVQGAPRRRPGHRVVLRQGQCRRAPGLSSPERRDSGRGDGAQALSTTSASPSARLRGWSCRCCATPSRCRSREIEHGIRDFAGKAQERHADARGSARRHVHHHQRRRLRIAAEHADPESAAGRHSRSAQDRGSARGGRTVRSSSGR